MDRIKISAISYFNSLPFLFGLKHYNFSVNIELVLDNPAVCADRLIQNDADIGLIPVVELNKLSYSEIISDYCIGTINNVNTVAIFSNCRISDIKKIYLDKQSRTSNILCKVLAENFWKMDIVFEKSTTDMPCRLNENEACLLIGDRVFEAGNLYGYKYDLSKEWDKHTGLPFVFAVWAANKPVNSLLKSEFNNALKSGIDNIDMAIEELAPPAKIDLLKGYCTKNISYIFDKEKKAGLNLFLKLADKYL